MKSAKKVIAAAILGLLYLAMPGRADPTTPRLGLDLIPDGSFGWGAKYRTTLGIIDSTVAALSQANVFTGTNTFNGPVIFSTAAIGGNVDLLNSTQTLTAGKTFNSWTTFVGTATFTSTVTFSQPVGILTTSPTASLHLRPFTNGIWQKWENPGQRTFWVQTSTVNFGGAFTAVAAFEFRNDSPPGLKFRLLDSNKLYIWDAGTYTAEPPLNPNDSSPHILSLYGDMMAGDYFAINGPQPTNPSDEQIAKRNPGWEGWTYGAKCAQLWSNINASSDTMGGALLRVCSDGTNSDGLHSDAGEMTFIGYSSGTATNGGGFLWATRSSSGVTAERMRIQGTGTNNGFVGINTNGVPGFRLDVQDVAGQQVRAMSTQNGIASYALDRSGSTQQWIMYRYGSAGSDRFAIGINGVNEPLAISTTGVVSLSTALPIGSGGTNSATALNNNRVMISSAGAIVEVSTTGLTTTVLHGNPSGPPTFSQVSLSADVTGTLSGSSVSGGTFGVVNGSALTNLTAANVTGSNTLPDGVLSTNVPLLNASNTFTGRADISSGNKEVARFTTSQAAANNYMSLIASSNTSSMGLQIGRTGAGNMSGIRGGGEFRFYVAGTDGSVLDGGQPAVFILSSGHMEFVGGTAPTVSSCGTTPNGSVVGNDNVGTITVGGGVVTACTLNFATNWTNVPVCVISDNSTAITGDISSIAQGSATFSFSASLGGGKIYYRCGGYQ